MRLAGKVTMVTGGASGIGEAMVRRLRAEGAEVVLADVDEALGAAVAADCATFVRHGVAGESSWQHLMGDVVQRHGGLEVLMNDAGIISDPSIERPAPTSWNGVLAVNVTGRMLGCRSGAP